MSKKRHWFFDSRKSQVRTGIVPEYADGHLIRTHSHPWHQLLYASRGVMTVRTPDGAWVVPTNRGVWVPARTRHSVQMSGPVSLRTLYLLPSLDKSLPDRCRVVGISPLLRELILRIVELDTLNIRRAAHAHLISVLLDHLQVRNWTRLRQMAPATQARPRAPAAGRRRRSHVSCDGCRLRQYQRVHFRISNDLRENPRSIFPLSVIVVCCLP